MAEWRIGRGWSEAELSERLIELANARPNFRTPHDEMTVDTGWNHYYSESVIAEEPPGPPLESGPFRLSETAVANYQFSDPRVVLGHFDASGDLLGRRILLEMRAFRGLHYLAGALVSAVRAEEDTEGNHVFGFRYDTLEGHIEKGWEWFLLTKDASTGSIRFRIEAVWLPGDFPNWWSRAGFHWAGPHYQRWWHHQAHRRLFWIARGSLDARPIVGAEGISHSGPVVGFKRTPARRAAEPPLREEETIQSS